MAYGGGGDHWMCSACTYGNLPQAMLCEICGNQKTLSPRRRGEARSDSPPRGWSSCPTCTFANPPGVPYCGRCHNPYPLTGAPSPRGRSAASDQWPCPVCTLLNDSREQSCVACGIGGNPGFEGAARSHAPSPGRRRSSIGIGDDGGEGGEFVAPPSNAHLLVDVLDILMQLNLVKTRGGPPTVLSLSLINQLNRFYELRGVQKIIEPTKWYSIAEITDLIEEFELRKLGLMGGDGKARRLSWPD